MNDLGELVPDIRAEAAIIYNPDTQQVLWEENSQNQRSIASITKVMTAEVVLEDNPDLTREVVDRARRRQPREPHLPARRRAGHDRRPAAPHADCVGQRRGARAGAHLAAGHRRLRAPHEREGPRARPAADLLRGSVRAAGRQRVVGLRHGAAHRVSPSSDERIASIMRTPYYTVLHQPPRDQHPQHESAAWCKGDVDVRAGKTGFISKAGYCLATLLRLPQIGRAGRGRRARRALERRPLHGDAAPVQLAEHESAQA